MNGDGEARTKGSNERLEIHMEQSHRAAIQLSEADFLIAVQGREILSPCRAEWEQDTREFMGKFLGAFTHNLLAAKFGFTKAGVSVQQYR